MADRPYTDQDVEAARSLLLYHYTSNGSNPVQAQAHIGELLSAILTGVSTSGVNGAMDPANPNDVVNTLIPAQCQGPCSCCGTSPAPIVFRPRTNQLPALCRPANETAPDAASNQVRLPSVAEIMHPPVQSTLAPNANLALGGPATPVQALPISNALAAPHSDLFPAQNVQAADERVALNPQESLQAYLLRLQRLAGVAPQDFITIPEPQNGHPQTDGPGSVPSVIQVTRDGAVVTPQIPPARFDGVITRQAPKSPKMTSIPLRPLSSDPANYLIARSSQAAPERPGNQNKRSRREGEFRRVYRPARNGGAVVNSQGAAPGQIRTEEITNCPSRPGQHTLIANRTVTMPPLAQQPQLQANNNPAVTMRNNSLMPQGNVTFREFNRYHDIPGGLTGFPQLVQVVIQWLRIEEFINLCKSSRQFYLYVRENRHDTIVHIAMKRLRSSTLVWPYPCYYRASVEVQFPRYPGSMETLSSLRPALRWLKMLSIRDRLVREIMSLFASRGFALVSRCEDVFRKIWFLMDIPDNRRRHWTVQNRLLWSDWEVFHGVSILAQLEALFNNHPTGTHRRGIRRLLMAQKNLILLRDAVKGNALGTQYLVLQEYMRWRYRPLPAEAGMHIFGNRPGQVGLLQWENYGRTGSRVLFDRPDTLLLKECARRRLDVGNMYITIYLRAEMDPNLPRDHGHEPESTFMKEAMDEAARKNESWYNHVVLDRRY